MNEVGVDPIASQEPADRSDRPFQGPAEELPDSAGASPDVAAIARRSRPLALLEVLAVSGLPTQVTIAHFLALLGLPRTVQQEPSLVFFATLGLFDTVLVVWLIGRFLSRTEERPTTVFLGDRPVVREIARGLALVPLVLMVVGSIVLLIRQIAPWMRTVERNPLESFLSTPAEAAVFLVVVVVGGGLKEELQRAFILHRFEQSLGGARIGLVLFSIVFGLLHFTQGMDVALAIGCLGLLWGAIYLRRRSAVMPMTNHAAFNALQVVQVFAARSVGM